MHPAYSSKPVDEKFALQHRDALPPQFFSDLNIVEAELARGDLPEDLVSKGEPRDTIPGARSAILFELHRLLCTDDPFYGSVRSGAKEVTQDAAKIMGGVIAGTCGLTVLVATGMVAFLALAVMKLGAGLYCTYYSRSQKA